MMMMNACCG
jgi:hypothetical protein